jgi:GNAT superfamily N-acetyltransferase
MIENLKIDYLMNHPNHIEQLAKWRTNEWGKYNNLLTYEYSIKSFKDHCNNNKLPLTYICLENAKPIGMVSLRKEELPEYRHLEPWIGGLFVDQPYRKNGVGSYLLAHVEKKTAALNYKFLHLFIFDLNLLSWYQHLGYEVLEHNIFNNYPIIVMRKNITVRKKT